MTNVKILRKSTVCK